MRQPPTIPTIRKSIIKWPNALIQFNEIFLTSLLFFSLPLVTEKENDYNFFCFLSAQCFGYREEIIITAPYICLFISKVIKIN